MNSSMICRIWSCLVLYLRSSRATSQLLRIWHSVCRSPHNLQAADKCSFFLHRAKLALWGRVSLEAFSANFICANGRDLACLCPNCGCISIHQLEELALGWQRKAMLQSFAIYIAYHYTFCFSWHHFAWGPWIWGKSLLCNSIRMEFSSFLVRLLLEALSHCMINSSI